MANFWKTVKMKGTDLGHCSAKSVIIISFTILLLCLLCFYTISKARQYTSNHMEAGLFSKPTNSARRTQEQKLPTPNTTTDFKLFIGILTQPDRYWLRNILRLAYGTQHPLPEVQIDVKFILCNLTKEDHRVLVALEIMYYDDIIILNCTENMNNGKTYTYFSSLPELLASSSSSNRPYDYVMKADDDIYFRLGPLVESLRPLPRVDLYYGLSVPCNDMNPFGHFMTGMGYVLSWDLVQWIGVSDIPKNNNQGGEDGRVGYWLNAAGRGQNRHNTNPAMYDYNAVVGCPRPFSPDTIGVHRLKDERRWVQTFTYFKATQGIQPSKLYHL